MDTDGLPIVGPNVDFTQVTESTYRLYFTLLFEAKLKIYRIVAFPLPSENLEIGNMNRYTLYSTFVELARKFSFLCIHIDAHLWRFQSSVNPTTPYRTRLIWLNSPPPLRANSFNAVDHHPRLPATPTLVAYPFRKTRIYLSGTLMGWMLYPVRLHCTERVSTFETWGACALCMKMSNVLA